MSSVARQARMLDSITADLLTAAQIQRGTLRIDLTPLDPRTVGGSQPAPAQQRHPLLRITRTQRRKQRFGRSGKASRPRRIRGKRAKLPCRRRDIGAQLPFHRPVANPVRHHDIEDRRRIGCALHARAARRLRGQAQPLRLRRKRRTGTSRIDKVARRRVEGHPRGPATNRSARRVAAIGNRHPRIDGVHIGVEAAVPRDSFQPHTQARLRRSGFGQRHRARIIFRAGGGTGGSQRGGSKQGERRDHPSPLPRPRCTGHEPGERRALCIQAGAFAGSMPSTRRCSTDQPSSG